MNLNVSISVSLSDIGQELDESEDMAELLNTVGKYVPDDEDDWAADVARDLDPKGTKLVLDIAKALESTKASS